jgi:phospholipid/cholesterol/gamma-HCH transport system substrate-binding protein
MMMRTRTSEISVGVLVILGAVALFFLAMRVSGLTSNISSDGYTVQAHFSNIGGLTDRAKVTMSGVTIGRVTSIRLDPKRQDALVELKINADVNEISTDAAASILTSGLLGEQYIGITPGADSTFLKNGDEIELTQSALVLEDLIGKFLFNKATETPANTDQAAATAPVAASADAGGF